jgi:Major intrinsic protein
MVAVTIGLLVANKISVMRAVFYILAQVSPACPSINTRGCSESRGFYDFVANFVL